MSALGKLVRTTAFKLSLAYLIVFTVFAALVLGYVAWNARQLLDAQITETIEAEVNGLAEQYRAGGAQNGMRRLIAVIERRSRQPGAFLYLLKGAAGDTLAGNAVGMPPDVLAVPGWHETSYQLIDDQGLRERAAMIRVFVLPTGHRLMVGRDMVERERLRAIIRRGFNLSLLVVIIMGTLGALFIARRVLRRVDAMTAMTQSIMAGNLLGRLPVGRADDELDRLAKNLNAMLDRIGELMTGLREVSDNIAHDLKTPLTRLRNGAEEALRASAWPEEHKQALERVIEESDGLIRTFNALLMIARAESGTASEASTVFDASAVASDVAELYEPVAEEAGARLTTAVAPGLRVAGNRELLSQALANLIDNAIKYGIPGAERREIAVQARNGGADVEFVVADHGTGVPSADRDRVLERFVRLDQSRERPGSGLGLSLASAIAHFHGGRLRLEDNAPGLRVVLTLPAAGQPA